MKEKSKVVSIIAIIVAALLIVAAIFCEAPWGLTQEGFKAICVMLAAIVLWVTEALPVIITCLGLFPAFTYLGLMTTSEFFAASSSTALFFTLAGFGIGAALLNTSWAYRLINAILKWAKGDTGKIVSGFLIVTALVSVFVSDYAAIIAMMGLAVAVVKAYGDPTPGTSNLAKGIMMALPFGAMCGGIATPASNSLNVTLMSLLEANTGINVTFIQWAMLGVPCSILLTVFAAFWLPRYVKPEKLTKEQIAGFDELYDKVPEKTSANDWKFIVIVGIMVILWIASNWVSALDVTRVALLGVIVMFLPGINLLTGKQYMKNCAPMGLIMLLCIMPIATVMKTSGAGQWIADTLFGGAGSWPRIAIILMLTLTALIIHIAVPSGASNAAICGALMFGTALSVGIPGTAVAVIFGCQCGNNFLMAYEGIYSFTYGFGHYSFKDVLKGGLPISICQYILCVLLIPLLAGLFGFA